MGWQVSNFTHALLYVRPYRDNVVKFLANGQADREVERAIDSIAFAKMNDDKRDNIDYDEVCDVINAVISELDGMSRRNGRVSFDSESLEPCGQAWDYKPRARQSLLKAWVFCVGLNRQR